MILRIAGRTVTAIAVTLALGALHWSVAEEIDLEKLYVQLLVEGHAVDLNKLSGGEDVEVHARLYRVAKDSNCVPGVRWSCTSDYYLAIGEYGDHPRRIVMPVGEFGGLRGLEWLVERRDGLPVLRLETDPRFAGEDSRTLEMAIGVDRVGFKLLPDPDN